LGDLSFLYNRVIIEYTTKMKANACYCYLNDGGLSFLVGGLWSFGGIRIGVL